MFILDNLLLAPFNSLLWVFKEVNQVVQQETSGEAEGVTRMLSELYMRLDTGSITEEQFEAEEKRLLDRLDAIELRRSGGEEESEDAFDAASEDAFDATSDDAIDAASDDAIDAASDDAVDEVADAASGEGETDTDEAAAGDASEPPDAKRNK